MMTTHWNCRCVLRPANTEDDHMHNRRDTAAAMKVVTRLEEPDKFPNKEKRIDWLREAIDTQFAQLKSAHLAVNEHARALSDRDQRIMRYETDAEANRRFSERLTAELNACLGFLRHAAINGDHAAKSEVERLENFLLDPSDRVEGY